MMRMRKWLIWGCGVAVAAAAVAAVSWWYMEAPPMVTIPKPKMPRPNAYDYYVAAGRAMRDAKKIAWAIDDSKRPPGGSGIPEDRVYSPAEKAALITKNREALALVRQGFTYEYRNPPMRSLTAYDRNRSKFRTVARLLVLEGQTKEARGDWAGAMDSYLDAVRMGEDIPRGGVLITKLVGIATQDIGRHEMWKAADHLSAERAAAAARRMEDIMARHVPYADVLQEEKWLGQAGLVEMMAKPTWRIELALLVSLIQEDSLERGSPGKKRATDFLRTPGLLMRSKRAILFSYTRDMDLLIARARLRYAAKRPPITLDPVTEALLPIAGPTRFWDTRGEAQNALLTVALALHVYRLEHSRHPATLAALVPSYLKRLPNDPFALAGPLRYEPVRSKYVLYSVGPDSKDDGGRPIVDAKAPTSATPYWRHNVDSDSKGDIVAGVNTR